MCSKTQRPLRSAAGVVKSRSVWKPVSSMTTISPGSTSRMYSASMRSSALVSLAIT